MTQYVHGQTRLTNRPGHLAALEEERDRLAAEALVYGQLYQQQQHLAHLRKQVHRQLGPPPAAETIRQAAIIRNNDSPETCARRLNEAEADAARWIDPRSRKEAS